MRTAVFLCLVVSCGIAQVPAQFVGAVKSVNGGDSKILIQPDSGEALALDDSASTVLRVAPGERDLKKAEPISIEEVASGDRVLVALEPGTQKIRRILVMSRNDIAKRDEADRLDWERRGISGMVRKVEGSVIVIAVRGVNGVNSEQIVPVTVTSHTSFRRWGADVVRFEDARPGNLAEIHVGDQIRTRGDKGPDGSSVIAQEIVSGVFQTRLGAITAIDADAGVIHLKEQGSGKEIVARIRTGAKIRTMPAMGDGFGARPGAMPPPPGGPNGLPAGGPAARGQPDVNKLVEQFPLVEIADVRLGETAIVAGTKGENPDELTAITVVLHADILIRMSAGTRKASPNPDMGGADLNSGLGGLGFGMDLAGMPQ